MAKATEPTQILTALESFVGGLGEADIRFSRGDLVEATHPAVKKWPHLFGPISILRTTEPRIEQATAAPGEKRGA